MPLELIKIVADPNALNGISNLSSSENFDWLIDYLADEAPYIYTSNDETEGDALLALSAMRGLGSSAKRPSYIKVLLYGGWNLPLLYPHLQRVGLRHF
jgi:hypothetical protein